MIDKSSYQAPEGDPSAQDQMEVEIAPPEENEDGSVTVTLDPKAVEEEQNAQELKQFDANLAGLLSEDDTKSLGDEINSLVESDTNSRRDWTEVYVRGLDVLGLKYEERTEPWDGACGVYSSLLSEAAMRFQAETIMETFPAAGPVKSQIIGMVTPEKEDAADRVQTDMNYALTERMPEYRAEHERMLYNLGLAGSAFKKIYKDPTLGRAVSMFVPAEDIVVPYGASNIQTAERITHILRRTKIEMEKLQADGFYSGDALPEPTLETTDVEDAKNDLTGEENSPMADERYMIYECHLYQHFESDPYADPDGLSRPYVITVDKGSGTLLAIRRNWVQSDPKCMPQQHFVHYEYVPGFGFYGMGLIHLIGGYARAGTSIIRQLVDAGTLANLPGGMKSRGLRIKGDDTPISPGEWRDVDVPSGKLQDNVMPLPYKEPSVVLHALLQDIVEEGRRLGAISDMDVSDMSAQMPVGTTLAILERTLKPMSAVQARVHYAMKTEFKLLAKIIGQEPSYTFMPDSGNPGTKVQDYAMVDVIPVSDPNSTTMAQRVVQYQAVMELAKSAPQIYDLPTLHRQMIEVLGVKNGNKLVPTQDDMQPMDPVSENMALLTGKPVKAFIYQDQQAHITAHMAFMQDPVMAQMIGQNPMAQQLQSQGMAHVAEHLGFKYRNDIQQQLGVSLPPPGQPLPPDVEVQLAQLVAQAGQQLLQNNTTQAQQQEAAQQQQDPLYQLEQAKQQTQDKKITGDLQLKANDLQRKWKKDQDDVHIKELQLAKDAERTGVMGRSQDIAVEQRDRDTADKNFIAMMELAQNSNAGPPGEGNTQ